MSAGQLMLIASASNSPAQGAAKPGMTGNTGDAQAFPQMLVQFVNGKGDTQASGTNVSSLAALLQGEMALADKDGLENLISLVDEIQVQLDQLDEETDPAPLEEMAAELQALLYTITMMLPAQVQNDAEQEALQSQALSGSAAFSTNAALVQAVADQGAKTMPESELQAEQSQAQTLAAVPALKNKVEELLQQIRTVAEQGLPKPVQAAFSPLLENKLEALKQWLAAGAGKTGTAEQSEEQQLDLRGGTIQAPQHAANQTLLARLGRSSFHPLLKQASETGVQSASATATASAEQADLLTAGHNPAAGAETVKPQFQAAPQAAPMPAVPADRFAERMESFLFKQMQLTSLKGMSEARISLFPEHLGQVDIKLTLQNGQLTALFVTDSRNAKDMLENQMSQLRAALQQQGLQVDRLEVTHAPESGQNQYQNGREQGSGQQQQTPGRQGQASEQKGEDSFESEFRQLSEQLEDSINVTA
ncbi:flagellar hook-length control protein FliK [Paenibacillus pinihumi]|uniref:flagellar hook-length control protein FliK n=1 Tax=Paenibacillus pinihumi TaxID=669462 RepID=UPI001FDF1BBC|nr:flagellar hook-length control protein FliK [Paenibacillus pinihumi]